MKKEQIFTIAILLLTAAFITFVVVFERDLHAVEQSELERHAKIIASSLWNLDALGPQEYLILAMKEHHYDRLTVMPTGGKKAFFDKHFEIQGVLNQFLISWKMIHPVAISADITYERRRIGRITANWYCTSVYTYLYTLVILFLAMTVLWYHLGTIEVNRQLEERVRERTVDLMEANRDLHEEMAERHKAQRALSVNEERLNMAMEGTNDGLWDWNMATGDVFFSRRWLEMLDYEPGDIPSSLNAWEDLIHPGDFNFVKTMLNEHLKRKSDHYRCEYRMRTRSGGWKWILDRGRIVERDERGTPLRLVGTHTDITDQKNAEEKLRVSEHRFRTLFESMIEGTVINKVIYDDAGKPVDYVLLDVNPAYEIHTDLTREEAVGAKASELYGTGAPPYLDIFERVARTGEPTRFETEFAPMNRHFAISVFCPVKGQFAAVFEDITDRKKAEAELLKHREHLEELVKERTKALESAQEELVRKERLAILGQLTGTVAHELRNPLGTVRGSLFTVSERLASKDPSVKRALDRAERNIVRCDAIIEELLDYTRRTDLELNNTKVDDWLDNLLEEQLLPDDVVLTRELNSDVLIPVDRERLRRCVINVFNNACEAVVYREEEDEESGAGREMRLTVATERKDDRLDIRFVDTGRGIPAGELEKIFEPLYSTKSFGVGLGLATVRQIMEQHKGGIEIQSEPNCGTTVTLWLPLEKS